MRAKPYKMPHASVSSVNTKRQCPVLWVYRYPLGIESDAPHFAYGSRIHSAIEHYLLTGERPDNQQDWAVIEPGLRYLPPAPVGEDVLVEARIARALPKEPGKKATLLFDFPGLPVPWLGYIDVTDKRQLKSHGRLVVLDHKTSKDPGKWAKNAAQLKYDLQMNVYALAGYQAFPQAKSVEVGHITYRKPEGGPPMAVHAQTPILRADAEAYFERVVEDVVWMHAHQGATLDDVDLPRGAPNAEPCKAYGGCDFQAQCALLAFRKPSQHKVTKMPDTTLQDAFDALCPTDQAQILTMGRTFGCSTIEQIAASRHAANALKAMRAWAVLPTPDHMRDAMAELEEHELDTLRLNVQSTELSLAALDPSTTRPEVRDAAMKAIAKAIAERPVPKPSEESCLTCDPGHPDATFPCTEGMGPGCEDDSDGFQGPDTTQINPPDAAPNGPAYEPPPEEVLVTDAAGVGKTMAQRLAVALGLGQTIPTVAQVAACDLPHDAIVNMVRGLSEAKLQAILALASESDGKATETHSDSAPTATPHEAPERETEAVPAATSDVDALAEREALGSKTREEATAAFVSNPEHLEDAPVTMSTYASTTRENYPGEQQIVVAPEETAKALSKALKDYRGGTLEYHVVPNERTFDLYVRCVPTGEPVVLLSSLLAPYLEQSQAADGVQHYSLTPFGTCDGAAVGLFVAEWREHIPAGASVLADVPETAAQRKAIEVLSPLADLVVRGW